MPERVAVPSPPVIVGRSLTKRFDDFVAVDAIDFEVRRGEFFGFLGPNGAGKTSTMRMIGCVSPVSEGDLTVLGYDPRHDGPAIRARLGVVPQEDTLDTDLTVLDNVVVYGRYFGIPRSVLHQRADELLEFVQLADRRQSLVEPLSGGMRRRLSIARALVNEPELILLDEPTTGLDPQARHLVWERLWRLRDQGATLVLTTHYMDEAEQLCDRLVIMDDARIVAEGSPAELITAHATKEVVELRFESEADRLLAVPRVVEMSRHHEVLAERVLAYTDDGEAALNHIVSNGVHPSSVLVRRSTLEDVFLLLTGRTLVD